MGPNQSTSSGQDQLPCLGILIPQPLLEECAMLREEFDKLPMGVGIEADHLHRLKYLLNLTRLPINEDIRAEYKQRVELALKFRRDYEFLRGWLLTNGDCELEDSTLEAIERQRKYFGPKDHKLELAIRQSLDARRNKEAAGGQSTKSHQDGRGRATRIQAIPRPGKKRRRSSRWRRAAATLDSSLETVLEASEESEEVEEEH